MAALTIADVEEFKLGDDLVIQKFSATSGASADATDEWIATNLKKILAVFGVTVTGSGALGGGTSTAPVAATNTIPWIATNPSDGDTVTVNGTVYTLKTAVTQQVAPVAAVDTITSTAGTNTDIANGDTVTIGNMTYKWVTALTLATAPTHAVWTFTFGATDMSAEDNVVVGQHNYTYKTTPTNIFDVDIQGTEATAAQNFKWMINHDFNADASRYMDAETPPHTQCHATVSGAVVTITAFQPGVVGNLTMSTDAGAGVIDIVQTVTAVDGIDALQAAGANEVLLGSDDDDSMGNLAEAINGDGTPGTNYLAGIATNPDVTAAQVDGTGSAGVCTLTARVPGTAANAVAFTEVVVSANITFTGAGTLGGSTAGVDAIIPVPYEVLLDGTEATMSQNFVKAINNDGTPGTEYGIGTAPHPDVTAAHDTVTTTLTARVPGTIPNALTLSESSTGITAVGGATFSGGTDAVADAAGLNVVLNSQGTANAASSSLGDLGIESSGASTTFEVVVLGVRR